MKQELLELKQYIEKELQIRKFLTDGLGFIETLESLSNQIKELEDVKKAKAAEATKATNLADAAWAQLKKLDEELLGARKEAALILDKARATAEEMLNAEQTRIENIRNEFEVEIAENKTRIKKFDEVIKQKTAELDNVENLLSKANSELEKVRKKLGL